WARGPGPGPPPGVRAGAGLLPGSRGDRPGLCPVGGAGARLRGGSTPGRLGRPGGPAQHRVSQRPLVAGPGSAGFWRTISTRRFIARPVELALLATGELSPLPWAEMRAEGTRCATR